MGRHCAMRFNDARGDRGWPAVWFHRASGRWTAHEHPRRGVAARGARLQLRAQACWRFKFTLGTGKLGDLAGFSSAIVLALIAVLIGYESIARLFQPVPTHFAEAIPIGRLGLAVNIASAWLLSSGGHRHGGFGTRLTITTASLASNFCLILPLKPSLLGGIVPSSAAGRSLRAI